MEIISLQGGSQDESDFSFFQSGQGNSIRVKQTPKENAQNILDCIDEKSEAQSLESNKKIKIRNPQVD